jgi:hypothetical protein
MQDKLKRRIGAAGARLPTGLLQRSRTEDRKDRAIPAELFAHVKIKDDPGRPRADPDHLERDA